MNEFNFVIKQETLERNIAEFAKKAAKYDVEYTIRPTGFGESRVTLSGAHTSKIAILTGILSRNEE